MKARASLLDLAIGAIFAVGTFATAVVMIKQAVSPHMFPSNRLLAGLAAGVLLVFGALLVAYLVGTARAILDAYQAWKADR